MTPAIDVLPATRPYIGELLREFLEVLRAEPPLPSVADSAAVEQRIVDAGELMVKETWRRLGLTVIEQGDRKWGLEAGEPRR
jgi:hypothetical protein